MEGRNVEWKREGEEGKSEGEWILLEKGISLGKKVVITGLVISTIPLVLPSILIVSALGFTFSVPFGVVFATYSFTKKLMNKLLPIPEPSPMEVETISVHEDEEGVGEGEGEGEAEKEETCALGTRDVDMEEGEIEQMESSREGEEKRIGSSVENENELPKEEDHEDVDVNETKRDDEGAVETLEENEKARGLVDVKIEGEEGEEEAEEEEKGPTKDEESGKVEEPLPPPEQDQEKGNVGDSEKKKKKKKKKKDGGEEKLQVVEEKDVSKNVVG